MSDIHTAEFENENRYRKYPFAEDASLDDKSGKTLGNDVFVDAVLYPVSGLYSLVRIRRTEDGERVVVELVTDTGDVASGVFDPANDTVHVYDEYGFNRGVFVCGPGMRAIEEYVVSMEFSAARICSSCQFELGDYGVSSVSVNDTKLHGDISFSSSDGRTAVKAVSTSNLDGSNNVRFDVVPNTGIYGTVDTGVRTIYILRQPESFFNVIDNGGKPYLILVNPNRANARIDRDKLCSYKSDAAGGDYKEKSYREDCGFESKKSVESSGCFPSAREWDTFMRLYDPETKDTGKSFGYIYGYKDIPAANGFTSPSSMCLLFIEGTVSVCFSIVKHAVLARFHVSCTEATDALFYYGTAHRKNFEITVKYDKYKDLFNFLNSNKNGGLGYVDFDEISVMCHANGWFAEPSDIEFPDDVDVYEFTSNLKKELSDGGFVSYNVVYTNRARDYFEHFNCLNWEVSSESVFGNEVKWLVGWKNGNTQGAFFRGGNGYSRFIDGDNTLTLPKWLVARYVWWKKYSKRGDQVRHFIVPKERGLVIYTGDYYEDDDPTLGKEWSPASWTCDTALVYNEPSSVYKTGYMSDNWTVLSDRLRTRLHAVYPASYDPTHGDSVLYALDYNTYTKIAFPTITVDELEETAKYYDNSISSETEVSQPSDAPIYTEDADTSKFYLNSWKGPFEYEYGRVYVPGVGYPEDGDDWREKEAIKAPIAFKFDITKENSNSFDFDVTDLTASGLVYKNPIHVNIVESSVAPARLSIKDPTDTEEVADEVSKLTGEQTSGNGIEISIPGLGE